MKLLFVMENRGGRFAILAAMMCNKRDQRAASDVSWLYILYECDADCMLCEMLRLLKRDEGENKQTNNTSKDQWIDAIYGSYSI